MDGDGQFFDGTMFAGPDPFLITLNGSSIFNYTFANFPGGGQTQSYPVAGSAPDTGASTVNTLGYLGFPGPVQDATYNIILLDLLRLPGGPPGDRTLTFVFTGNSNEGANNEFYGIDNIVVTVTNPIPTALPLFATGLGGLGLLGWRRKRRAQAGA